MSIFEKAVAEAVASLHQIRSLEPVLLQAAELVRATPVGDRLYAHGACDGGVNGGLAAEPCAHHARGRRAVR